jgi:hypothetical protein
MDIAEIDARLKSAAARYRSANVQVATFSAKAIAAIVRAALPQAAMVGLAWSGNGPYLDTAGYFTAAGQRIGFTADGAEAGDPRLTEQLRALDDDIGICCRNLDDTNQGTWEQYLTDQAPGGYVLDGEYRLIIDQVLRADAAAQTCGCPPGTQATAGGVLMTGHTQECASAEPRLYVWLESGTLTTGTLAGYGRAWALAHGDSPPGAGLGDELRTWDASYPVQIQVEGRDDNRGQDGCWPVRVSVPGEQVTVRARSLGT